MTPVQSLDSLEREKATLIQRYLEIQDTLDDFNEQMYKVCCEIEALNLRILQVRDHKSKARSSRKKAPPSGDSSAAHAT